MDSVNVEVRASPVPVSILETFGVACPEGCEQSAFERAALYLIEAKLPHNVVALELGALRAILHTLSVRERSAFLDVILRSYRHGILMPDQFYWP